MLDVEAFMKARFLDLKRISSEIRRGTEGTAEQMDSLNWDL